MGRRAAQDPASEMCYTVFGVVVICVFGAVWMYTETMMVPAKPYDVCPKLIDRQRKLGMRDVLVRVGLPCRTEDPATGRCLSVDPADTPVFAAGAEYLMDCTHPARELIATIRATFACLRRRAGGKPVRMVLRPLADGCPDETMDAVAREFPDAEMRGA